MLAILLLELPLAVVLVAPPYVRKLQLGLGTTVTSH